MSEKCPVCEHPVDPGATKCDNCAFEDESGVNREWLNVEDANRWTETVVKPYRERWGAKRQSGVTIGRVFVWGVCLWFLIIIISDYYNQMRVPMKGEVSEPVATAIVPTFGSFIDSRDGKEYRTVTMGSQKWMAENLNYKTGTSGCYDYDESNCKKYGRLYNWNTAKSACPKGWHLPSNEEWDKLVEMVGGFVVAGKKLKSETGWKESANSGTDEFGFSAVPGGYYYYNGGRRSEFGDIGAGGYWWSASEGSRFCAYYWKMDIYSGFVFNYDKYKDYMCSVRCSQTLKK